MSRLGLDLLGASSYPLPSLVGEDATSAADVKTAQQLLAAQGFKGKDGKALKPDGKMGANTEAAITAFWASKGMSHAPVVDAELLDALRGKAASGGGAAPASGSPSAPDHAPASGIAGFFQRPLWHKGDGSDGPVRVWHAAGGALIAIGGAIVFWPSKKGVVAA